MADQERDVTPKQKRAIEYKNKYADSLAEQLAHQPELIENLFLFLTADHGEVSPTYREMLLWYFYSFDLTAGELVASPLITSLVASGDADGGQLARIQSLAEDGQEELALNEVLTLVFNNFEFIVTAFRHFVSRHDVFPQLSEEQRKSVQLRGGLEGLAEWRANHPDEVRELAAKIRIDYPTVYTPEMIAKIQAVLDSLSKDEEYADAVRILKEKDGIDTSVVALKYAVGRGYLHFSPREKKAAYVKQRRRRVITAYKKHRGSRKELIDRLINTYGYQYNELDKDLRLYERGKLKR